MLFRSLEHGVRDRFAGDVVAPRTVLDAVLEGRRAALAASARTAVPA